MECVSSWSPELRLDTAKRIQALTESPLPAETQSLLRSSDDEHLNSSSSPARNHYERTSRIAER